MKKHIKRLTATIITLFALLGVGTTIAFASGYINWNGSSDYFQLIENLNQISERGQELKSNNENIERELEQMNNKLL